MTSFFGFFREGLSASPLTLCGSTLSPVIGLLAMVLLVPLNRLTPYPLSRRDESGGVGGPDSRSEDSLLRPPSGSRSAPASAEIDLRRLGGFGVNFDAGPSTHCYSSSEAQRMAEQELSIGQGRGWG